MRETPLQDKVYTIVIIPTPRSKRTYGDGVERSLKSGREEAI
jgi:hypothetical protein